MYKLALSAALILTLVSGCKSNDSTAEKMVTMLEDLGNAAEKAGDDCGKMADSFEAIGKKYDLAALKADAEKMKGDKAESERLMKKYGDRMQKAMPKLMGAMKCAEDPKMKAVNEKFKDFM